MAFDTNVNQPKQDKTRRAALAVLGTAGMGIFANSASASPLKKSATSIQIFGTFKELLAAPTLKAGMFAQTMGYHQAGDTGGLEYEIVASENVSDASSPYLVNLTSGLKARILHRGFVNYPMFGTLSDGQYDDGIAIKKAHEYANHYDIPVVNANGEYWIKDVRLIPIKTDVSWGSSIFHIDEQKNSKREPNFEVLGRESPVEINLTTEQKSEFLKKLKPGVKLIPELAEYKNHLIVIQDTQDRIGVRSGALYNASSWAKEELFYVEEFGHIIGDIAWEFSNYTKLTAYPTSKHYCIVEGGTFYLSGNSPGALKDGYHQGGITTRRSRTILRNQWVGLEKGKEDISLTPRSGFYTFSHVYDVLLENIRLIPWEKERPGTDRDLLAGTYGIGGSRILNATFRNVTAEGSPVHWGVFGTNLNKNFTIENCRLNRIDVHFHCWNIRITDCTIGMKGITLTGGGELFMENTTVFNNSFVNFRADYGAKWDGPIRINNCRLAPIFASESQILSFVPSNFNYKYPIGFGHQIIVTDFTIDYRTVANATGTCWLMRLPNFSETTDGIRLFFPYHVEFRNIMVNGREKGVRMFTLPDVTGFQVVARRGSYSNDRVETNSYFHFENVQLEKPEPSKVPSHHLSLNVGQDKTYKDGTSLLPSINVKSCQYFSGYFGDSAANIRVENSSVSRFTAGSHATFKGEVSFLNCQFNAAAENDTESLFPIKAESGISFTNCLISAPIINEKNEPAAVNRISFIELNKRLQFNHLNTRLDQSILRYCKEKGIQLTPKFISMLKAHHELESSSV